MATCQRVLCVLVCIFINVSAQANSTTININNASAAVMADALPGIGPVKARAIVKHREIHGQFGSVDALLDVKGIGAVTLARIKHLITVQISTSTGVLPKPDTREAAARRAVQNAVNLANKDARAALERKQ